MEKDDDEEEDERLLLYDILDDFLTLVIIIMGRLSNLEPFELIDGSGGDHGSYVGRFCR